jgi:hypothetical protein
MKKKKIHDPNQNFPEDPKRRQEKALDILGMMKHKELVCACILRGMPFEKVLEVDHNGLGSFFIQNFDAPEDPNKLTEYDSWLDNILEQRGHKVGDAIRSPLLKVGYVGKGDLSDAPTKIIEPGTEGKKLPEVKEVKEKREKDETTGVVSGTKKNLTYTLAKEGVPIEEVVKRVIEQFPEAKDKSIKIWYKRALKGDD